MNNNITWTEAVTEAIDRLVAGKSGIQFSRQELIDSEMANIVAAVGSLGVTPEQTLSRELQQLRDAGKVEFLDDSGNYRSK